MLSLPAAGDVASIEAKKTMNFAPADPEKREVALAGSAPLLKIMKDLPAYLSESPFTTAEIGERLDLTAQAAELIEALGLQSEEAYKKERSGALSRLLERQRADGGFASLPRGKESDVPATAFALTALSRETSPWSRSSADRAAEWLSRQAANAWFEEKDRPLHALGFLSLARAHRADLSALRYFAETSRDKDVSALTAAQIATSLSLASDEPSAATWRKRAVEEFETLKEKEPAAAIPVLAVLAEDPAVDRRWLEREMSGLSSSGEAGAFVRLVLAANQRPWSLAINGATRKANGLVVFAKQERRGLLAIKNIEESSIFVATADKAEGLVKLEAATTMIQQRLYQLDGGLLSGNDPLTRGAYYVLEFSGPYLPSDDRLVVQTAPGAGFAPALPADAKDKMIERLYPWLGDLTAWDSADWSDQRATFVLPPRASKAADHWRLAYLVRAERGGVYAMPAVSVRSASGEGASLTEPGYYQVKIK
jgi:hypothetical protein